MNVKDLKGQGAFIGAPVPKEIEWEGENGEKHQATAYVRKLGYKAAVYDVQAAQGLFDGIAGRIAACICDEDGKPVFTPGDVTGEADPERGALNRSLTLALLNAIGEVNSLGKNQS